MNSRVGSDSLSPLRSLSSLLGHLGLLGTIGSLSSLSFPAVFEEVVLNHILNLPGLLKFWQVFVLTAPLLLGVAIIIFLWRMEVLDTFLNILLGSALVLLITTAIAKLFGLPNVPSISWAFDMSHKYGAVSLPIWFVVGYFKIYPLPRFISSVLIGAFLGFYWGYKMKD